MCTYTNKQSNHEKACLLFIYIFSSSFQPFIISIYESFNDTMFIYLSLLLLSADATVHPFYVISCTWKEYRYDIFSKERHLMMYFCRWLYQYRVGWKSTIKTWGTIEIWMKYKNVYNCQCVYSALCNFSFTFHEYNIFIGFFIRKDIKNYDWTSWKFKHTFPCVCVASSRNRLPRKFLPQHCIYMNKKREKFFKSKPFIVCFEGNHGRRKEPFIFVYILFCYCRDSLLCVFLNAT